MNNNDNLKFKKLLGIEPQTLGEMLIISPFLAPKLFGKELKNPKYFRGLIYSGVQGVYKDKAVTFVNTGMGQSLVEDCVMAQSASSVSKMIFVGAAGAVRELEIGDCVLVQEACFYSQYYKRYGFKIDEEISEKFQADISLIDKAYNLAVKKNPIKKIRAMSVHSLWDQDEKMAINIASCNVQAIELECAFFYMLARKMNIKPLALCFISDHIIKKQYWTEFSLRDRLLIKRSVLFLIKLALELSIS